MSFLAINETVITQSLAKDITWFVFITWFVLNHTTVVVMPERD